MVSGQWLRDQWAATVAGPLRRPASGLAAGVGWAGVRTRRGFLAGGGASPRASTCPRTRDSAAIPHSIPIPLLTANPPGRPLAAPTVPKLLSARHFAYDHDGLG